MIFDPWLYFSTVWGTIIFYDFINFAESSKFDSCADSDDSIVIDMDVVLKDMNAFTIILWLLCAASLPFGILIDYFCMVFREWKYGRPGSSNQDNLVKQQEMAKYQSKK